ncbi:MAG: hypothetical protein HQ580_12840 [Planctomycetes bacterium]|nr:hypothetical protein [Planctomycetota bacterium]
MVKKRLIILIGVIIVCTGGVLAKRNLVEETDSSTHTQWEYGVYRIGVGRHQYEWQDADKRTYAKNQTSFLERMGLISIIKNLSIMSETPRLAEYVLDAEFINHLGTQGWELVDIVDKSSRAMVNRTFWFKRQKL